MIGWGDRLADYISGARPKKAQSIPASLFYKKDGLGIHKIKSNDSLRNLVLGEKRRKTVDYLPFDLFISEKHKLSFRVGDHPLQNGVTISDHVRRELREVTIEGMFTNHPLKKLRDTTEIKFKDEYATREVKPSVSNIAIERFTELMNLANAKVPVRLVCSLETYPKMVITEIDYDRDSKSGSSIRFSMTLREIITVDLKTSTENIEFNPSEMKSAQDKAIAAECNLGRTSGEKKEVDAMAKATDVDASSGR